LPALKGDSSRQPTKPKTETSIEKQERETRTSKWDSQSPPEPPSTNRPQSSNLRARSNSIFQKLMPSTSRKLPVLRRCLSLSFWSKARVISGMRLSTKGKLSVKGEVTEASRMEIKRWPTRSGRRIYCTSSAEPRVKSRGLKGFTPEIKKIW
jgi:hypothetical protein